MTTKDDRAYLNRRGGFTKRTEKTTIKRARFDGRGDYIGMGGMSDSRPEPLRAERRVGGRPGFRMGADELGVAEDSMFLDGKTPEEAARQFVHVETNPDGSFKHTMIPRRHVSRAEHQVAGAAFRGATDEAAEIMRQFVEASPVWLRVPKDRRSKVWTDWELRWGSVREARRCVRENGCATCAAHLRHARGTRPPVVDERRALLERTRGDS